MDTEFMSQLLAFQKRAMELAKERMPEGATLYGYVFFEKDIVRVLFDYPNYEGTGSILIPWSDLTL